MTTYRRQSREEGHNRKFLVVIDETPECERAVFYASRRAERTGGKLTMLYVINPSEFQHWLGVESIMRSDAEHEARRVLGDYAEKLRETVGIEPEAVIREGVRPEEVRGLIEEDKDIAILVLAAGHGGEGPGPLVSEIAGRSSAEFPVPITIVPGTLSDEDINALA
ncbi:universal stress protein [Tepidamorphus sp. 3E244]|uniref:universal stress protein n=1 Tax=Tepidamorphus sp. 3E244 TaxID=3385498 RepID=UPI0038FCEB15